MLSELNKQYKLEVIKDLGMFPKNNGTYKLRRLVLLCPICNKEFEVDNNVRNKNREMCFTCVKTTSVTNQYPRLYNIWKGMRHRVTDPNKAYSYADKGISVCEEWSEYTVFRDWALDNGYCDSKSIDRIDNDGNYQPSNCRWANNSTQLQNTRKINSANTSGYRGVSKIKSTGIFNSYITVDTERIVVGYYRTALEAAKARDSFILDNKLADFTLNDVLSEGERVSPNKGNALSLSNKSGYVGVSFIKRLANTSKPYFVQVSTKDLGRVFNAYVESAEKAAFLREDFIRNTNLNSTRLKLNFTDDEYNNLKLIYS